MRALVRRFRYLAAKISSDVKTLICASCNLVISELFAFFHNKFYTMDNEKIIRIYQVEVAKTFLFDFIKTKRLNISRRKGGKIQRDLEDIMTVFKYPDTIAIYVARELNGLPPATFDHVDVTALLKDILIIKAYVDIIKQNYVSSKQIEDLENKLLQGRYASLLSSECKVNTADRWRL